MGKKKAGKKVTKKVIKKTNKVQPLGEVEIPPVRGQYNKGLAFISAELNKTFGKGTIGLYGEEQNAEYDVVTTGSLTLDRDLGCGGIPKGRVIEIYGPEAAGKTFLTAKILSQFQKHVPGKKVAFIDAEHALDPTWTEHGPAKLKMGEVLFCQPQSAEEGLRIAHDLVISGEVSAIAIDSVSNLTPKAELEGEMGDSHVGLQARLIGQAMRKLVAALKHTGCTLILINQLRMKIGVLFGSPETTSGGNAIKFNASMRFRVSKKGVIGDKGDPIGWEMIVRIKKNKCGVPQKEPEVSILHDRGFWQEKEMVQLGVKLGIVKKGGAWYSLPDDFGVEEFNGLRLGQGVDAAANVIEASPKLQSILRKRILAA